MVLQGMYRGVVTDFDSRRNGNVTDNLHADLEPGDASYIKRKVCVCKF